MNSFLGKKVCFLFLLAALVGFFSFAIDYLFIFIIQGFLHSIGLVDLSKLSLPSWYPLSLISCTIVLIIAGIIRGASISLKFYVSSITNQAFIKTQRSKTLYLGLNDAPTITMSTVIEIFTERISQSGSVLTSVSNLISTATSVCFLFILGMKIAPLEMTIGITSLGIVLLPLRSMNRLIKHYGNALSDAWSSSNKILIQGIKQNFFLRIYSLIDNEIDLGIKSIASYEHYYRRYFIIVAIKFILPMTMGIVLISIITYVSMTFTKTHSSGLLAFFYVFIRLSQCLGEINSAFSDIRLQIPSLKILRNWHKKYCDFELSRKKTRTISNACFLQEEFRRNGIEIELRNVNFGHSTTKLLFSNYNLKIQKGEAIVIKGESGTGKSTLLHVILGIYKPLSGHVFFNGQEFPDILNLISDFIGYVGAEPYLIPGTVRENILFGHPKPHTVSTEELYSVLNRLQLGELIASLPKGIDEYLFEQTQFSTGQKQRLSMVRALLRRPLLLILDEGTANLDFVTEQKIINELEMLKKNITTLIVTHKHSFDEIASKIVVLDGDQSTSTPVLGHTTNPVLTKASVNI
ncbi:MAG: ABC transporter ATP-binding protein [Oligoflexia bacterium]|nr:ABC transporter ATP-binding protein [Oligoflexia bacterium]